MPTGCAAAGKSPVALKMLASPQGHHGSLYLRKGAVHLSHLAHPLLSEDEAS